MNHAYNRTRTSLLSNLVINRGTPTWPTPTSDTAVRSAEALEPHWPHSVSKKLSLTSRPLFPSLSFAAQNAARGELFSGGPARRLVRGAAGGCAARAESRLAGRRSHSPPPLMRALARSLEYIYTPPSAFFIRIYLGHAIAYIFSPEEAREGGMTLSLSSSALQVHAAAEVFRVHAVAAVFFVQASSARCAFSGG